MPQVDAGLADTQQKQGNSGAQTAAVTGHLQQMALHLHLSPHTVQAPVIWEEQGGKGRNLRRQKYKLELGTNKLTIT